MLCPQLAKVAAGVLCTSCPGRREIPLALLLRFYPNIPPGCGYICIFIAAPPPWHIMKLDLADSKKSRTMVRISNLVLTLLAST